MSFVGGGALGVADGVGGWADSGINPAAYSRTFMRVACAFVEGADPRASIDGGEALSADASLQGSLSSWEQGSLSSMDGTVPSACPRQAMDWAHKLTDVPGSATACVVSLCQERRALVAANLGDSGFLVLKNGSPALRSRPLQHFFDCPLQFGSLNHVDATDSADQAETFTVPVEPGDVIIMGSDGLWDNAYEAEIVALAPKSASDARAAAQRITEMARDHAADPSFPSPYTQEALKQVGAGCWEVGGWGEGVGEQVVSAAQDVRGQPARSCCTSSSRTPLARHMRPSSCKKEQNTRHYACPRPWRPMHATANAGPGPALLGGGRGHKCPHVAACSTDSSAPLMPAPPPCPPPHLHCRAWTCPGGRR